MPLSFRHDVVKCEWRIELPRIWRAPHNDIHMIEGWDAAPANRSKD